MKPSTPITQRTALVTGGSRGIGKAVCLALAGQGFNIAVGFAGNAGAADDTAAACKAKGVEAIALQADVRDEAAVKTMVHTVNDTFGRIDVLVCSAGIAKDGLIMRTSEADFDSVTAINLKGTFLCIKAVSKIMMKQRYGRIIALSSVVGLRGNAGQTSYAASKAGVVGIIKSVAKELATRGITANAVAPGFIETDMTAALSPAQKEAAASAIPIPRLGRPEDVASAVAFLAGESAGYTTGQVLSVDGGMAI
ncbi:MAG: 3-oxoacyl-[acyl-carrier-protein] reductase [Eubacteriaceae bacterium]|nr:3-oxoacyl-[acyl-carrier-protein] reductase [Eubacteriaceae bacterium]